MGDGQKITDDNMKIILARFDKLDKIGVEVKKINAKFEILETQMKELENLVKKKNKETEKKIANTDKKIDMVNSETGDELEAIKKSNEVIITGIPAQINCELPQLYRMIGSTIGLSNVASVEISNNQLNLPPAKVYKLQNNHNTNNISLLIRFENIYQKEIVMSQYFKHSKELTLDKVGFPGNKKRFFMHHNLTKPRYNAYKLAQELKKSKKVDRTRIIGFGAVAVWFAGDAKSSICNSVDDVNSRISVPIE
jgi:hypothetical protein